MFLKNGLLAVLGIFEVVGAFITRSMCELISFMYLLGFA